MIQFTANGSNGPVLGVGLAFHNLERMRAGDPAVVNLDAHGSAGRVILACVAGTEDLARLMARFPGDFVVGLTERTVNSLRAGEAHELQLTHLRVPNFHTGILFAGPTEFEIVNTLRASGLVSADTPLTALDDYARHARNEVEGCPFCRARTHRTEGDVPHLGFHATPRWIDRLSAHPFLAALALLGLFALVGLAVSLAKTSPYR